MKKFIAFALVLVLAFAIVFCDTTGGTGGGTGGTVEPVGATSEKILAMYSRRSPTKSETVATYTFSDTVLQDTTTLISGKVDGTKEAAKLIQVTQRLRTVADGSNAAILGSIEETTTIKEYFEGYGVRTKVNKGMWGGWDTSLGNFAPDEGSIALNITDSKLQNIKEEGKSFTFTVAAVNTESVFGKAIASNVNVMVVHDGACVVQIALAYTEAATANTPATDVEIVVNYTYDIENITIGG